MADPAHSPEARGQSTRTPKKPVSLACKRCRLRKQKARCNQSRPCSNCSRANAVCISTAPVSRKNHVNPEYARSLEMRVLELEAQANQPVPRASVCNESEDLETVQGQAGPASSNSTSGPLQSRESCSVTRDTGVSVTSQASSSHFPRAGDHSPWTKSPSEPLTHKKEGYLIQTYLQRVNPRYPFLHEESFLAWYDSWKNSRDSPSEIPVEEQWKHYFVTMVFAVSLLIGPQVSSNEMDLSKFLYSSALEYLDAVLAKPEPILHVQAYLLRTLHALQSPSSPTLITMTSTTMRYCVISKLHLSMNEPEIRDSASLHENQIRRRVFWSAYAIDRLVSWIYHIPCCLSDENIQTKLFANLSDDEIKAWTPTPLSNRDVESLPRRTQVSSSLQLIGARRVQSRILHIMMRADYEENFASRHDWRLHMLEDLDQWKMQPKPHSDLQSKGYTSEGWVGMTYNYTVLLLHRPTKDNVNGIVGEKCVQACVELISVYRQYQKSRQTAQLWPGLLSQFGVGITLLYCFWATTPPSRTTLLRFPGVLAAIRTCSVILAVFSERWKKAEVLRDVFDILSDAMHPFNSTFVENSDENEIQSSTADQVKPMMPLITSMVVDDHVCRMIMEMVSEKPPRSAREINDEYLGWTSEDVHDPHTCHLCTDQGFPFIYPGGMTMHIGEFYADQNTPFSPWLSMGVPGASLDPLEQDLSFPCTGLFGSAEF